MDQPAHAKWEWTVSAPVKEATADQIWPLLNDYFNLSKWFPGLPTSYGIHGNNGEVGCIRYNAGFNIPSLDGTTSWAKAKLTAVDPEEKMIRYEIVDCNTGFNSYVSTVKICPGNEDCACVLSWFSTVDPLKGITLEELAEKYEYGLKIWAKNMEDDALGRSGKSEKWEWSVSAPVKEATADQLWPLLKDFFNLHKWFPGLPTCYGIHGNNGEVGSIRYCGGLSIPSLDGKTSWAKVKLTTVDPAERMIRFENIEGNTGLKNYVSTVKISPGNSDVGCVIWWFAALDPIPGVKMENLVDKFESSLKIWAKNMEDDVLGRSVNSV